MKNEHIIHGERSDGDPCALIPGHRAIDEAGLAHLNKRYRDEVQLDVDEHPDDMPWEHRYCVTTTDEHGDEKWDWTATADAAGAVPITVWLGP